MYLLACIQLCNMLPTNYTSDVRQSVYIHVDTTLKYTFSTYAASKVFVHIICYKEEGI